MTQRSKLDMEAMFRRCLPESKRYGTKLVFRQGSPLVPSDLRLVAASKAAATIVISDQSRSAAEADAQAVRWGRLPVVRDVSVGLVLMHAAGVVASSLKSRLQAGRC